METRYSHANANSSYHQNDQVPSKPPVIAARKKPGKKAASAYWVDS